jgi:iron(III) transport system substrate-binding protein
MVRLMLAALLFALGTAAAAEKAPIGVYSERKEFLIQPLFDQFTKETGIPVRFITDQAPVLIERMASEGKNTRADLFLAVDAGNLWLAAERGLLAPVKSSTLEKAVPANLRDPQNQWFGLSQRARTIMYSSARVDPKTLSTYAALAEPKWRGKLCLRSSKKVYNQSLIAMHIKAKGETATEAMVRGWVANLAAPPFADDTLLLQAIASGQCEVGITNTYYLGRLIKDDPAFAVRPFWANQAAGGVHVNISGAGVTKNAPNRAGAVQLLEWLAGKTAQKDFAQLNFEYPVDPTVAVDPVVAAWGKYRADPINVVEAGRLQQAAVKLMDRAGWR